MFKITFEQLKVTDDVIRAMNNLHRWTSYTDKARYNELAKQSLNCLISYLLAVQYEQKNPGKKVRLERLAKLAISRGFQKAGLADVAPSTYATIVEDKLGKELHSFYKSVEKMVINKSFVPYDYIELLEKITEAMEENDIPELIEVKEILEKISNPWKASTQTIAKIQREYEEFLNEANDSIEEKIYQTASKIATLLEVLDLQEYIEKVEKEQYNRKYVELYQKIDNSGLTRANDWIQGNMYELLKKISSLRNQNRWAVRSYRVNCSVLGHLFDTAVYAFFMALYNGKTQAEAARMFFMGIWHDIPEAWTKDIPSPTKDAFDGFREASEQFELECVDKEIYKKIPNYSEAIQSVMMEDEANQADKKLLKRADYLSADSECYRQLVAGSSDEYFREHVIIADYIDALSNESDPFYELVKYYWSKVKNLDLMG